MYLFFGLVINGVTTHTPEEYDFPDKLYEDYLENAYTLFFSKVILRIL